MKSSATMPRLPATWRTIRTSIATWPRGTLPLKPSKAHKNEEKDCNEPFFAENFFEGCGRRGRGCMHRQQVFGCGRPARARGAATLFGTRADAEGFRRHAAPVEFDRHQGG